MKYTPAIFAAAMLGMLSVNASAADPAPTPAKAFFVNLKNHQTVENPVKMRFGLTGMKVVPAGYNEPGTGHFHLLIDTQLTDAQKKLPIPNDSQHIHFGKGQTETTQTLTPGSHTLQLVMGDGMHVPHNPPVMSDVVTIEVK